METVNRKIEKGKKIVSPWKISSENILLPVFPPAITIIKRPF
jgi:hypothetical protein